MQLNYDFKVIEPSILKYWKDHKIYEKAKERNRKGKDYYFLDGPPYTSGRIHIGTAWNKSLKDLFLRYKRMQGFNVWDRAGYDMHGLPTEHATEKKLGIKDKQEILKYGVDKFVQECKKLCIENMHLMSQDFIRMGVWMDFENAYQSIKDEFIEGEWWLIKRAHEQGRLYEGLRTMTWCSYCQTALAKHELEYQNVKDDSVFIKFKISNAQNEYLVVWTTTPWTIPLNLAVMVHPELDYQKCRVENEVWVLAKALAGIFIQGLLGKKYTVIEEFKGEKLEDIKYEHPLYDQIPFHKLKNDQHKLHTVILSEEYVDTSAGTGLVHCAPGCGPEDYEVGHRNGLEPYNPLDEKGIFPSETGIFKGLAARKDDKKFTEELEKRNCAVGKTKVDHEYAHCQRCKNPVIYRATTQWFFKVEDLKQSMIKANEKIKWMPDTAFNAFNAWLENLRDNSITKQRFWGTPLPVWKCQKCGKYDVVASKEELKKVSGQLPKDLHKPGIDEVRYKCDCNGVKERIPDILDVWVDAGTTSWNCLDYPKNQEWFKRLFPAEFILEGKDQIRGWFNLLMVASTIALGKPSFKSVYMHGFVQDALGRKMSKSLGNYILPEEVVEKHGADTFRYYTIGGANPGIDLNYNFEDMKTKHRNLLVLWNIHKYILDLAAALELNPSLNPKELKIDSKQFGVEEKYIFSKLNSAIRKVTDLFESLRLNEVPWAVESLYLELSRVYIQLIRDKVTSGSPEDKKIVLFTIYQVFIGILKMFSAVCPFISEKIYLNLKEQFGLKEESIHHFLWPSFDEKQIDEELEQDMVTAQEIVTASLAIREKIQMGIRWPLQEAIVVTSSDKIRRSIERLETVIKSQINIKELRIQDSLKGVETQVKGDFSQIGPDFGDLAPKIIARLTIDSPHTILKHLDKEEKYELTLDKGEKVNIVKEHVIVTRKVPESYEEVSFSNGFVYLNKRLNEALEAEGYAREVMRRAQALRKKGGLEKKDTISLFVKVDEDIEDMLKGWIKPIQDKVGAKAIKISSLGPSRKHEWQSKERVRDKEIELHMDKL